MAKHVYLLRYNNYFNRTIKGYNNATIDGYIADGATLISNIPNCTLWNPGDGVDTVLTSKINMYAVPDYCVVTDEQKNVLNRWFVMEATRIQGGQYRLRLHRDLIADSYNVLMQSPDTYVERGYCDVSNDAIYNSEPITFNQIKTSQLPLTDKSGTAWIVGYMSISDEFQPTEVEFSAEGKTYVIAFNRSNILKSNTTPYSIFYLPYGYLTWNASGDTPTINQTHPMNLSAAMAISRQFSGGGVLLDLQILPYCPDQGSITAHHTCNRPTAYIPIQDKETGAHAGYLGNVINPNFTGTVYQHTRENSTYTSTPYRYTVGDIKRDCNTKFVRMMSPNGNGAFEFNPAKMVYTKNASIGFSFSCTYMPYQPYIKVEPAFARLYGGNYDDTRGLICGGDYSLPQIGDAWKTYQIQNKNYQAMFNRNVESLDLQNTWAARQDVVNAVTGTFTAAIGGATAGTMIGGGVGAVVGGIAGGLTSAAGGALDVYANRQLRADQRDNMITQENLRRDNIRALPQTITKATNFNVEMPLVPYLEVYDCSDSEKADFARYLALKSYTISRYGALIDYKNPNGRTWLQGQLIKIDGIDDDAHYVAALADEVHQGFYVQGGD